jgi:hypothetical protein
VTLCSRRPMTGCEDETRTPVVGGTIEFAHPTALVGHRTQQRSPASTRETFARARLPPSGRTDPAKLLLDFWTARGVRSPPMKITAVLRRRQGLRVAAATPLPRAPVVVAVVILVAIAGCANAGSTTSDAGHAGLSQQAHERGHTKRLRKLGVVVSFRSPGFDGRAFVVRQSPRVRLPTLQVGTFKFSPTHREDPIKGMRPGDSLLTIAERVRCALVAGGGTAELSRDDFLASTSPRVPVGHAVAERGYSSKNRRFEITADFAGRQRLTPRLNRVDGILTTLDVRRSNRCPANS